ncbi:MAG: adenylate cyclase [Rhizobiales bacterium]|nr:adenylate cyclase [Hyphomicrobiales bacterium]
MPEELKSPEEIRGFHADPLYLSALASLGTSVSARLTAAPAKGSIAVLPFLNMSGDPEQEHFTDGLTEDIITDLSNVPGFFVIARNSSFAYKGKPTDVRQIAHDLGVKYILEGSARRSDKRLRINVQLIDAADGGTHVWAERFDRDLADIFAVQDEVTRRVVGAITGKLNTSPLVVRHRPVTLEAYDLCVRARSLWWKTTEANQEAMSLLERATALDPNYAEAHWQLALVQFCAWQLWGAEQQPHRADALLSARRAVEIDPNDSSAYWVLGYILLHDKRWEEGAARLQLSIRLNPNDADAQAILSELMIMTGRKAEAIEPALMALRLNPLAPGWIYWILGIAQIANGQFETAVATLRREETTNTVSRRSLAAALALMGRLDEAKGETKLFLESNPHWRIRDWQENHPLKLQEDRDFWVEAYRLAGLPD